MTQNPHFFTSLGRLRERSRRKQESSKYTGFYSLSLQGYIPWPLQGGGPGAKKNETIVPGAPRDPKVRRHASQGAPRDPQGATTRLPGSPQGPSTRETHRFFIWAKPPWRPPLKNTNMLRLATRATFSPFGSQNAMSRALLGPSNLAHASPRASLRAPVGQTWTPRTSPGRPGSET